MRILVLSENLQKGLALVNHAISSRTQLPILSHILMETREGKIVLCATDLEIGIETIVPGVIEEEGATTVPAKLFLELVNTLPSGKITLSQTEGTLLLTGAKTKAALQITPPDEFPRLYERKGQKILSMPGKELQTILKRIIFSSSIEATRPALSGVLWKKTEEGVFLVATDGYRLSLEKISGLEVQDLEKHIIVPAKLLREVATLKEESPIEIYLDISQNQVIFTQEETVIVGRLIDAEFPNYEKIMPTDTASTLSVDREAFLRAVKACAVLARETANIVTMTLSVGKLIVSSKTPSLGENTVEVDAELKGEENAIAFNVKYLLDFLSTVESQEIIFEMTGPLSPGIFRVFSNPSYLHIIMPIRTQG